MFNIDLYKKYLVTENLGQDMQYFNELKSTNSKALQLAFKNTENGTVIITDNQTAGRGRQSNKWFSIPKKSLTFSVILYPNCPINQINKYSILTGLAVSDALNELNINYQLKWPNDILVKGKKVGGILCESKVQGESVKTLVIGVGINVNEEKTNFPDYLSDTVTSLKIEGGKQYQLELVLADILNHLEKRINQIDDFDKYLKDWTTHCSHLNQKIRFHSADKIISGVFSGLTATAQAIIIIDKKEEYFDSGIIIY